VNDAFSEEKNTIWLFGSLVSPTLYLLFLGGGGKGKGLVALALINEFELCLHQNSGVPIRLLACQSTAFLEMLSIASFEIITAMEILIARVQT
jgi:hypothetical protein